MPGRDILEKISSINLSLGEPVYTIAVSNMKIALDMKENPYQAISRMLSAVAQLAYAAQLHIAKKEKLKWLLEDLPTAPIQIQVGKDTLPSIIIREIVEKVMLWCDIFVDGIVRDIRDNHIVYVKYYAYTIPLKVLVMMSRHKREIEKTVEELNRAIEAMKEKAGSKEVSWNVELSYHDGVPEELRKRGFKKVDVVSGSHRGTDFNMFKEIMKKLGFELSKETSLGELKHVAARKQYGTVELWIDCDSNGFGFISVSFPDIPPRIPVDIEYPIEVENVKILPLELFKKTADSVAKKFIMVRKVQTIGNKLALYLTKPFELIGVDATDKVEIVVDVDRREITIRPIDSRYLQHRVE